MATTINSYSVGFGMDASNYIDGAKISRSETRKLITDIESARSPSEKFAMAHDRLAKALDSGAIELETYNRLLDHHKSKMKSAVAPTEQKMSSLEKLGHVSNIASTAIQGIGIAIDLAVSAKDQFNEVTERIDEVAKAAERAGISYSGMQTINFTASEAGVDVSAVEDAIKEMMLRGFVVDGDVMKSLKAASLEISGIADQSERVQRANEMFGENGIKMLNVLQQSSEELDDSARFAEKWLSLTNSQVIGVEEYNKTWHRVSVVIEGVANTFVAELAPVLTLIGEEVLGTADGFTNIKQTVREVVDTTVHFAGQMQDIYEISSMQYKLMYRMATLDFSGLSEDWDKATDLSTGDKWLQQVNDRRFELYKKGLEQSSKLAEDAERAKEEAKERALQDQGKKRLDSEGRFHDEASRLEEQRQREIDRLLDQSLAAAGKKFEDKRNQSRSLADSIAKGPADLEVGSAGAVKYMADLENRQYAEAIAKEVTPGETELLEEAKRQFEVMTKVSEQQAAQIAELRKIVEVTSQNGFRKTR